jgi:hypothetical protein
MGEPVSVRLRAEQNGQSTLWKKWTPAPVETVGIARKFVVMSQDIADTCLTTLWTDVGAPN